MEIAHILEELAYDMGELPREAIEAAISKREQITPFLLQILQDAIARVDEIVEEDNYQGHLYAMYLLAQFREEEAYPLIMQLISLPGEIPYIIAGDVVTEDLSRILASVCGKNIEPLMAMIEDTAINEYVRAACQTSLVTLVGCGQLPREMVLDFFKSLFDGKLERKPSFVWDNLIVSVTTLYPEELYNEICYAFQDNLVDPSSITLHDVATVLAEEKSSYLFNLYQNSELIEDTVSEMEKWLCGKS